MLIKLDWEVFVGLIGVLLLLFWLATWKAYEMGLKSKDKEKKKSPG